MGADEAEVGAAIVKLPRIVRQVVKLWRESVVMDELVPLRPHHHGTCVLRTEVQCSPGGIKRVIELAKDSVASGRVCPAQNRQQRLSFQDMLGERLIERFD